MTSFLIAGFGLFVLGRFFLRKWLYLYYFRWARQSSLDAERFKRWSKIGPGLAAAAGGVVSFLCGKGPEFGLWAFFLVPLFIAVATHHYRWGQQRSLERSLLSFLYTLQGTTEIGWSLPTSLFTLSHRLDGVFSVRLRRYLRRYVEGASLVSCLERYRRRNAQCPSARTLSLLELAYSNGLSLSPVLAQWIPSLELRFAMAEKQRALYRSVFGQGLIAAGLPYVVLGALWFFEPAVLQSHQRELVVAVLAVGAGQIAGFCALRALCRFY